VHSIVAALLASVLISAGYTILMRLQASALLSVIPVCLAGLFSHLILDLLTTGNMTVLWPFSKRNFAFNLTYFIDPTILGALLVAALFIVYTKADASTSKIVMAAAIAFMTTIFGVRWYMKNAATKVVRRLNAGVASEIVSLPTLRPDRWWTVRKTLFENGYRYETYRIDSVNNRALGKGTVDSTYINYSGPVEPPIDSPQKAVTFSKRDKSISDSIEKFVLPAVDVVSSNNGDTWKVFWYDAFTYATKGELRGIVANVRTDGTITVDAHWTHSSTLSQLVT